VTCPRCDLVNPESAQRCDCGYSFLTHAGGSPIPGQARADALTLPSPKFVVAWALVGFAVGAAWLILAFVFFTAPQSRALEIVTWIAWITCPALLVDYFAAPVLNAVMYGLVASLWFTSWRKVAGEGRGKPRA